MIKTNFSLRKSFVIKVKLYPKRLPLATLNVFSKRWHINPDLGSLLEKNSEKLFMEKRVDLLRAIFNGRSLQLSHESIGQTDSGALYLCVNVEKPSLLAVPLFSVLLNFRFNDMPEEVLIIKLIEVPFFYFWCKKFFNIPALYFLKNKRAFLDVDF